MVVECISDNGSKACFMTIVLDQRWLKSVAQPQVQDNAAVNLEVSWSAPITGMWLQAQPLNLTWAYVRLRPWVDKRVQLVLGKSIP
jgi:hypothetical protein